MEPGRGTPSNKPGFLSWNMLQNPYARDIIIVDDLANISCCNRKEEKG